MTTCTLCGQDAAPFMTVDTVDYLQCPDCRLTFMAPEFLPDLATERGQYDLHHNDVYDPAYRTFLCRLTNPLREKLHPDDWGLDYGCGPGPALAVMMAERGYAMEIYDPIYAPDNDVLEDQYEFITCTETAEHFHNPAREFDTLDRLLKPGGWLGIMTTWLQDGEDFARWHYRRDPTHVCFYRPDTFIWIARHRGWHVELPSDNIVLMRKNL